MVRNPRSSRRGGALSPQVIPLLLLIAAVTMCVGNFMAASQINLRRLLDIQVLPTRVTSYWP